MRILVIGDSCVDMFRYGTCNRLSPEAPVPVFEPTKMTTNGGMSINVQENIKALGVECDIVTNDYRPVKTRFVDLDSNQMIVRVDENVEMDSIKEEYLDKIEFHEYDAIVISDYNKGYLFEKDIEKISKKHPLTIMDTKKKLGSWAKNIEFIKINAKEFIENYSWFLGDEFKHELIVTQGKEGAMLNMCRNFRIEEEHDVRDLSGAGDTFLAAFTVKFLEKNNIEQAIRFANKCASWAVTQKGVVAIDPTKI